MQFHWISIIIIIAFHKNIKFGLTVNTIFIIMFTLLSSIIIFIYDLPPAEIQTARRFEKISYSKKFISIILFWIKSEHFVTVWLEVFYQKPWPHGSVFFTGLAFGYIVFRIRAKKLSNVFLLIYIYWKISHCEKYSNIWLNHFYIRSIKYWFGV